MKYQTFLQSFKAHVTQTTFDEQIHLAKEVCKRLYNDYKIFSDENAFGDADLILDTIMSFDNLIKDAVDEKFINKRIQEIEEITPDTDDFGDAIYALNSCVAVCVTLKFILDRNTDHILTIGTCLTDTIDFKIQEEDELNEDEIDNNPQMIEARLFLLHKFK